MGLCEGRLNYADGDFQLAYSIGTIDLGPDTVPLMLPVGIVVVFGMGVSLAVCLFFRISKIFWRSFLDVFFRSKPRILLTYAVVFVAPTGYAVGRDFCADRSNLQFDNTGLKNLGLARSVSLCIRGTFSFSSKF